jgi:hypothetical protein
VLARRRFRIPLGLAEQAMDGEPLELAAQAEESE